MDKNLKRIMFDITRENTDDEEHAFFVDRDKGFAYGGHRRAWGVGDLMARFQGNIEAFDWSHVPGVYHFSSETFIREEYLPGKRLPQGGREAYTPDMCNDLFERAFQTVAGYHQIVVNPKEVVTFIEDRTFRDGVSDRVMNILPFETMNSLGHFAGKVDIFEGVKVIAISHPNGKIPLFIDDRSSHINTARLEVGDWVIVAPIGVVEGRRIVKIMRTYQPGIRMAIQYFKTGTLMPGSPRYSIISEEDGNSITTSDVRDFKFLKGQDRKNLKDAPMLTVQLDTFYRGMSAMSNYKKVAIMYKDSHTPFVLVPFVAEGEDVLEIVCSSLSPYKSGKVVTI